MNILELYKILEEATFQLDFDSEKEDIICFCYLFHFETVVEYFSDFLESLDESVFKVELRKDYFVFTLKEICEHYEIDVLELAKSIDFDNSY